MSAPQSSDRAGRPSTRALDLLVVAHVLVAAAVIALAVPLLGGTVDEDPSRSLPVAGMATASLCAGLAALVLAQALSIRRLLGHRRATASHGTPRYGSGPHSTDAAVTAMYRIGWPATLAVHPLPLGMLRVGLAPPPPSLLAALCVLPCTSLLLDHAHAAWTHRHLEGRGPRTLPPGSGERARRRLRRAPTHLVVVSVLAVLLVLVQVASRPADQGVVPTLATALATTSAAALFLLLARPVRQVRDAVHADQVHPALLDAPARSMRRLGVMGVVGTAGTGIAVLTAPTAPLLAAASTLALVPAAYALTLQLASTTCTCLGDPWPGRNQPHQPARQR